MALTKTPFFGLGSRGSVGQALTTQRRPPGTLIRSRPIPSYRRTLPQQYQRWLYEDYAYWWTQQDTLVKRTYASLGVRYHLTGFQYWMKYMLTHLPDIRGCWRFDNIIDTLSPDSSKNNNPATLIGASLTTGPIGRALLLDGINDYADCGNPPIFDVVNAMSFECLIQAPLTGTVKFIAARWDSDTPTQRVWSLNIQAPGIVRFALRNAAPADTVATVDDDLIHHILATYNGTNLYVFIDGIERASASSAGFSQQGNPPLRIGYRVDGPPTSYLKRLVDNCIYYNRALDAEEARYHALRRYPA